MKRQSRLSVTYVYVMSTLKSDFSYDLYRIIWKD